MINEKIAALETLVFEQKAMLIDQSQRIAEFESGDISLFDTARTDAEKFAELRAVIKRQLSTTQAQAHTILMQSSILQCMRIEEKKAVIRLSEALEQNTSLQTINKLNRQQRLSLEFEIRAQEHEISSLQKK
jgi:hypothetical protein